MEVVGWGDGVGGRWQGGSRKGRTRKKADDRR